MTNRTVFRMTNNAYVLAVWIFSWSLCCNWSLTIDETMIDDLECSTYPCSSDEAGACQVYHNNDEGCSQCVQNSFKFGANYECVDCQEFFGTECMHCSDYNGCQQCSNGYYRTRLDSDDFLVYYCQEDACSQANQASSHCQTCNNGECSQCQSGYFKMYDTYNSNDIICLECNNELITGQGCLHCADFNGCQQCSDSDEREEAVNNDNGLTYYQCGVAQKIPTEAPTTDPTEEPTEYPSDDDDCSVCWGETSGGEYVVVYSDSTDVLWSWYESDEYCLAQFGTHLASIHSDSDNSEIASALVVWAYIGYTDDTWTWTWNDGTINDYSNWVNGSESSGSNNTNCAIMYSGSGGWDDVSCSNGCQSFVCSSPPDGIYDLAGCQCTSSTPPHR